MEVKNTKEIKMENKELLLRAKEEIVSLRKVNERLSIRVDAIDDMLSLLHGKPGHKPEGGMAPDIVWEINKALAEKPEVKP